MSGSKSTEEQEKLEAYERDHSEGLPPELKKRLSLLQIRREGFRQKLRNTYLDYGNDLLVSGGDLDPHIDEAIEIFDQELESGYIKKESAEYHQQEMIKCKASMAGWGVLDKLTVQGKPGNLMSQYNYHKSMYEQLVSIDQTNKGEEQDA